MSFRPTIVPVLLLALVAGCDKQVAGNGQADVAAAAATSTPARSTPVAPAATGRLDRSHRGEPAPGLAFEAPDGRPTTLAAFRGRPVLVNLWATWCAPCVREMPTLDAAAATVAVVPISQDRDRATVAAFFASRKFARLKPYLDSKLAFAAYAVELPMTILFDSAGREIWRSTGGRDWTAPAAKALLAEAK